jgi:hypothetical protein
MEELQQENQAGLFGSSELHNMREVNLQPPALLRKKKICFLKLAVEEEYSGFFSQGPKVLSTTLMRTLLAAHKLLQVLRN